MSLFLVDITHTYRAKRGSFGDPEAMCFSEGSDKVEEPNPIRKEPERRAKRQVGIGMRHRRSRR